MKKRLLSMLMAVLMIASLVPATALAAPACGHADKFSYSVKVDAAAKQPGVDVVVCNDCGEILKADVVYFAEKTDMQKCANVGHNWKTVELQKATCEQVGVKLTYCATCGVAGNDPVAVEAAKDHVYNDFTVVVKPTCEESGWGYAICANCKNPVFVADEDAAVKLLPEKHTFAKETAVRALFAPVNPKHADRDELVAVTEKTKIGNEILMPATKAQHSATVGGQDLLKYTAVVSYDNNGDAFVAWTTKYADPNYASKDFTGDAYCPYCKEIFRGTVENAMNLNHQHENAMTIKAGDEGYYPYIDDAGNKHDGRTDKVWCDTCKAYFGGTVLPYDEYFNPQDSNYTLKVGQTFTVPAVAPTCENIGWTAQTLTYTNKGWAVTDAGKEVAALGHHYVKVADVAPTCTKYGYEYDNLYACDRVVDPITGETCRALKPGTNQNQVRVIAPLHATATAFAYKQIVAPTCTTKGLSVKMCPTCGAYATDRNGDPVYYYVPAVECVAADELANVKEATCTEDGYTGDSVCKWCGKVLKAGEVVKAAGHTPEEVAAVAATCTKTGLTAGSKCSVCGEVLTAQEVVPALGHKFVNGVCTVCGEKDPNYVAPVVNPFKDVEKTSPYYDAIIWAADKGVTTGKTADTFGINDGCTRAQIVTFLYRAAGSPAVKADTVNPFTDVSKDSVYYNAILWAVEKGITKGTTETTFDPNAVCTRGQIVTFLFRASGDEKVATGTNFADVAAGSYCADAVAWAVANKVANGFADGSFRPEATCTRGQAVTFIYRALAE